MEIRTLRYFLAVAREENMTRAAEFLHVTQPTLSKALKSLEEELGKPLFTRHSFSIRLTDEGMLLRNRAENLVNMADKISPAAIQSRLLINSIKACLIFLCLPNCRTAGSMNILNFLKVIGGDLSYLQMTAFHKKSGSP